MHVRRVLCAAALAAVAVGCGSGPQSEPIEFQVPVTVRDVETGDVEERIVATGTLRAAEEVRLTTDTAGVLDVANDGRGRRLVEGSRVRAGQLIAEITGEDVRIAARSEATQKAYEQAQRDYEQKKRLYDEGLISEAEFLPTQSRLADAKLESERSRRTEELSRLVTPISGIVMRMARGEDGAPLADGQRVMQGTEIARIVPAGALIADAELIGSDVIRVRPGQPARVRYFAWDERTFDGRVARLAPEVDPQTRTLRAEIAVEDTDGLLRPGMFVEVTIVADRREGVAVVPRTAVTERRGEKVVFIVEGQAVAQRTVSLGLGDDRVVEVREGVEVGDRVVVRGLETLSDAQKVRVTGG